MNSDAPSYSYLEKVLDPYTQPLKKAFDQEAEKYKKQISDKDQYRFDLKFNQLTPKEKQNWLHALRIEFDKETIENFYKVHFFRQVVISQIKEIYDDFDESHSQDVGYLFNEVKKNFSTKIAKEESLKRVTTSKLQSSLNMYKSEAETRQKLIHWEADLNYHLYSKAQSIIEEVRDKVLSEKYLDNP